MQGQLKGVHLKEQNSRTTRIDLCMGAESARKDLEGMKERAGTDSLQTGIGRKSADNSDDIVMSADFTNLFDGMYDATLVTDDNGVIVAANPRSVFLLEYERNELQGMAVYELIQGADQGLMDTVRTSLADRFLIIENCYCRKKNG